MTTTSKFRETLSQALYDYKEIADAKSGSYRHLIDHFDEDALAAALLPIIEQAIEAAEEATEERMLAIISKDVPWNDGELFSVALARYVEQAVREGRANTWNAAANLADTMPLTGVVNRKFLAAECRRLAELGAKE